MLVMLYALIDCVKGTLTCKKTQNLKCQNRFDLHRTTKTFFKEKFHSKSSTSDKYCAFLCVLISYNKQA